MSGNSLIVLAVISALYTMSSAASYSRSCIYVNGQEKCTSNEDPNGNRAGASAGVYGNNGMVASGVGNPDYYSVNRDQIGNGGNIPSDNGNQNWNPNNQPYPAYGNGAGGMATAGAGNVYFPRFDNPFQFVQDFMRGRPY